MIAIKLLTRSLPTLGWDSFERPVTAGPLYSDITPFCFTFGTHAQRLRFQRLQHTDSGPWSYKGMAFLQCFLPASPGSPASLVNALPAPALVSRRCPWFPCLNWAPLISCCWKGLSVVCQLHRKKGEDWALASLMLTSPYICFCFLIDWKNWSSISTGRTPEVFREEEVSLPAFRRSLIS